MLPILVNKKTIQDFSYKIIRILIKPGGCVAGGLLTERGVRPSYRFNIFRDEYFNLIGINDSKFRLQWYMYHNNYTSRNNHITTACTSNPDLAMNRLATFALISRTLLRAYANSPSRKDRWKVMIARDRVLYRFARRVVNLGQRDVDEGFQGS